VRERAADVGKDLDHDGPQVKMIWPPAAFS
jgi:hypothetical protein